MSVGFCRNTEEQSVRRGGRRRVEVLDFAGRGLLESESNSANLAGPIGDHGRELAQKDRGGPRWVELRRRGGVEDDGGVRVRRVEIGEPVCSRVQRCCCSAV